MNFGSASRSRLLGGLARTISAFKRLASFIALLFTNACLETQTPSVLTFPESVLREFLVEFLDGRIQVGARSWEFGDDCFNLLGARDQRLTIPRTDDLSEFLNVRVDNRA